MIQGVPGTMSRKIAASSSDSVAAGVSPPPQFDDSLHLA